MLSRVIAASSTATNCRARSVTEIRAKLTRYARASELERAFLGVEAQHRRAAVADLGVRRIGQDLGSVGLKGHRRTGRPRPDARSPDDLLRVHNSVEPLSQMRIALGAGVRGGTPALLVAQCRICAVLQQ